ncbi:MAG: DUF1175 domain-containing protein [Acidobacteriota bacterium]|nr:DUF1175 domain-containing protein [Acidobacteriota bacterium]
MRSPLRRLSPGTARAAALYAFLAALTFFSTSCSQTSARATRTSEPRSDAPKEAPARVVNVSGPGGDSDADGIPDREELSAFGDRESFRRWFTSIAEAQFYRPSAEWNDAQRDCAGLVRFAWRESLRAHDRAWLLRMGDGYDPVAPDVRAYSLARSPVGEKLFRTSAGTFAEPDLTDGTFSEFADARTLKEYNTRFVGRDAARSEPGDLVFFRQPWVQKYPYHVMVFLGRASTDNEGAADWVVYHTGSSPGEAGEVRKVRLSVLARHPDPRWRPVEGNRNFLGFYRLKILD